MSDGPKRLAGFDLREVNLGTKEGAIRFMELMEKLRRSAHKRTDVVYVHPSDLKDWET